MSKIISIGQAAKLLGVHVQPMRNWEKSGKLKPDSISPGGTRQYNLDRIVAQLLYKAQYNHRVVFEADTFFPSSKLCSNCGTIHKHLTLADRTY
ncbi:MAG: MerR family DNA-binding transcriptional regulator, partial [Succinivibrio sp.]|nr:MerR family DNA-binding transcriptional regulator [Succinivibrio sp.]